MTEETMVQEVVVKRIFPFQVCTVAYSMADITQS